MTFNADKFRKQFPEFSNKVTWSNERLQMMFDQATCYVWPYPQRSLHGHCLETALNLMVAHLAQLTKNEASNQKCGNNQGGIMTQATIGRVSVSVLAPPATDMWDYWLASTPYGKRLLSMLQVRSRGGRYIGGRAERQGFRSAGGRFW